MKYIYLVRHALTEPLSHGLDIDRSLTAQGHQDAKKLGEWMQSQAIMPAKLYCSPARRARQTAFHLATALAITPEHYQEVECFYNADVLDLVQWLMGLEPSLASVLLVGHNPSLSGLMNDLLGASSYGLKTATLGGIVSDTQSWSSLLTANHRCLWFKSASEF